jgi:hypothetical protein
VWLIAAAEIERYKFFGAYVDLCNPDAVRLFLDTTYQRYLDRLGPERFARLAGFFVDESHPQNWSWCLPDFFRRRRGYDLAEALPALWTDVGPRTARVRYDYMQSITALFVESFHRPLAEWCRAHGVALSLEVGSTRNVVQRYADVPGIDPGHEKAGTPLDEVLARELPSFRGNLTFPASLAAQTGKRRVLDELFHSTGWSLTLQDMKAMLDRAAARGANLFAFHAFCYTTGGLRKWDAPPSQFDQNPYWPHFPLLAAYAGRLGFAMSRGRRAAPIALVDPITSLWEHGEGTGAGNDDLAQRCAAAFGADVQEVRAAYGAGGGAPGAVDLARRGGFALLRTRGTLLAAGAAPALLDFLDGVAPPDLRVHSDGGEAARASCCWPSAATAKKRSTCWATPAWRTGRTGRRCSPSCPPSCAGKRSPPAPARSPSSPARCACAGLWISRLRLRREARRACGCRTRSSCSWAWLRWPSTGTLWACAPGRPTPGTRRRAC